MESPEQPQYYYDSSAQQWWIFNNAQGQWELCPDTDQTGAAATAPAGTQEQQQQQQPEGTEATGTSAATSNEGAVAAPAAEVAAEAPSATQPPATAAETDPSQRPSGLSPSDAASVSPVAPPPLHAPAPTATTAATAPEPTGSSASHPAVSRNTSFKIESSTSLEGDSSSHSVPPEDLRLRWSHSEEESDSGDALGNALERLMTTNFSRGLTGGFGDTSASTSFPWPLALAEEDEESDQEGEGSTGGPASPAELPPEPIVRRVTRRMTFKEQGGLSGCLQKAVQLRQHIIDTENGEQKELFPF